jgi:NAD(P)H dehydrogenase (quinone)
MPAGKGHHAPIAAEDQGRVIAAILQNPDGHANQTYPLFGPVEMDHTQMAAELTQALGRKITYQNPSIADYCSSVAAMGLPPYVVQHFEGAMEACQQGVMAGMNDTVERVTGRKPMGVGEFARKHADVLVPNKRTHR